MAIEKLMDYKPKKVYESKKPVYENEKKHEWKLHVKDLLDGGCLINGN